MTRIIHIDSDAPDPAAVAEAAEALRQGRLVAFPTETVYGLGANALDSAAVRRIFDAKGRPATDPLIVHLSSAAGLGEVAARLPDAVAALAAAFWPGPLTLVVPRGDRVPREVTAGLDTVAVRVPAHPIAQALIAAAGVPVAAPSANLFSRPSPTTAAHVLEDLGDRIDIIIEGGPTDVGVESTVLDLTRQYPTILRPGAVTEAMLRRVLPRVDLRAVVVEPSTAAASPGMLARHYSPRAPMMLFDGSAVAVVARIADEAARAMARGERVGIIAADEDDIAVGRIIRVGPLARPDVVATHLYAALRELDAADVDLILARQFPSNVGLGRAVRDRLSRAAAGRCVLVE